MAFRKLTVFLFNDLEPWERACVEPILENLSQFAFIETIWVTEAQRRFFKKSHQGDFWIVSRHWRRAIDFLAAKNHRSGKLFISILNGVDEKKNLYELSFQSFFAQFSKTTTLIVYSPLEYQFFREIKKVPESQIKLGSLIRPKVEVSQSLNKISGQFQVGTFCDFSTESNIHFFLGVAHFITKQNSQIHFNILGKGPLYGHFSKVINDLDLQDRVSIVETISAATVGALDLFIYSPIRNHHFIPVLLAGAYGVPVVSVDIPGIENFIVPDKTGILVAASEIKAMGEKILQLERESGKRKELGEELKTHLKKTASVESLSQRYQELFFEGGNSTEEEFRNVA